MTLRGVDTWASVSYFSAVLGPTPLLLDGVVYFTDREMEEGQRDPDNAGSCSVQEGMRTRLRRFRVNPCAQNLLRRPHLASRKDKKDATSFWAACAQITICLLLSNKTGVSQHAATETSPKWNAR